MSTNTMANLSKGIWWGWCGVGFLAAAHMLPDLGRVTWAGAFVAVSVLLVWSTGFGLLTLVRFATTVEPKPDEKLNADQIEQWSRITKAWNDIEKHYQDIKKEQDTLKSLWTKYKGIEKEDLAKLIRQHIKPSDN